MDELVGFMKIRHFIYICVYLYVYTLLHGKCSCTRVEALNSIEKKEVGWLILLAGYKVIEPVASVS